jgi:A/G-specific adenine glycosylase
LRTISSLKKPRCESCPLARICRAQNLGPEKFPAKAAKKKIPHKHVGAAVITDSRGHYLIAQRQEGELLGGLWEFPGGKQEPDETIEQCIAREIAEELGVSVRVGKHIVTVRHAFSHFTMDLHAYACRIEHGKPRAIQCAAVKWITKRQFGEYAFGRADQKIIAVLS